MKIGEADTGKCVLDSDGYARNGKLLVLPLGRVPMWGGQEGVEKRPKNSKDTRDGKIQEIRLVLAGLFQFGYDHLCLRT